MENLTRYALDGLRITNQELFNKRAYEIINYYNALNLMIDGVPVSVEIIDEEKLISYIQNIFKDYFDITIKETNIDDSFNVEVIFNYIYIRYYNNKKDAENKSWDYKCTKDEEYKIPLECMSSGNYHIYRNCIKNAGLKINIL